MCIVNPVLKGMKDLGKITTKRFRHFGYLGCPLHVDGIGRSRFDDRRQPALFRLFVFAENLK